jgi:hypothetical protein
MPHYALIDAARDARILPLIQQEAHWKCLFGGEPKPEIAPKAPYIVRLDPGRPLTRIMQEHGWLNQWGITCHARADLHATRKALRLNLEAVLPPDGRVALFRFYDPRVFVPFIEATSGGDLDAWFDPIDAWWARNDKTGATMKYTRGPQGLLAETL